MSCLSVLQLIVSMCHVSHMCPHIVQSLINSGPFCCGNALLFADSPVNQVQMSGCVPAQYLLLVASPHMSGTWQFRCIHSYAAVMHVDMTFQ